nr:hypothetical protein [Rhodococcus sp. 06-418-1B]
MAKRRGFFAEMQHQNRLREQRERQQARAHAQATARAVRLSEKARRDWERACASADRAANQASAAAVKERARLHVEAQLAEVEARNATLAEMYEAIDGILAATLEVDDYVDLSALRQRIEHPPFDRPDLTTPTTPPLPLPLPPEPVYVEPAAPEGLGKMLGGRKRHAAAVEQAQALYWQQRQGWEQAVVQRDHAQEANERAHGAAEARRLQALSVAQFEYEAECAERRKQVMQANVQLERLMVGLQEGEPNALEEYVSIVLGNSVYPECFEVHYDFSFHGQDRELELTVSVPLPSDLPTEKSFKYTKASDTITSTPLPLKARKDRYATAVAEVAVRTAHEILEADRDGVVGTLAMTVGVDTVDPATGLPTRITLVELATDRTVFERLNLSGVQAAATLQHLSAGVSKNPHDLVPVGNTRGVRG